MSEDSKKLLEELIKERDFIENSLRQSVRELEEMGVGPNVSLLDSEGYPRVDIDLYRVRSLRSSISRQQNDHKAIMKRIEALLPQVLPSQNNLNSFENLRIGQGNLEPFCKIGVVPTNSQAYNAGLCSNDSIVKFGDLTKNNFYGLDQIATEFTRLKTAGGVLEVKIKRTDNSIFTYKFDCKIVESLGCQILLL